MSTHSFTAPIGTAATTPTGAFSTIAVDRQGLVIIAKEHQEQLNRIEQKLDELLRQRLQDS